MAARQAAENHLVEWGWPDTYDEGYIHPDLEKTFSY